MVIFRKSIAGVSELSLARFITRARRAVGMQGRVTVLVTSSNELRDLNHRFRGKDKATDVLSFPAAPFDGDDNEGDIAISADIASENAARYGHRPADELKILSLHGILHLAGYDHETDNGKMARKEARLRRELHLPDALIERTERPALSEKVSTKAAPQRAAKPAKSRTAKPATGNGKRVTQTGQRVTGNGKRRS